MLLYGFTNHTLFDFLKKTINIGPQHSFFSNFKQFQLIFSHLLKSAVQPFEANT